MRGKDKSDKLYSLFKRNLVNVIGFISLKHHGLEDLEHFEA